MIAAAFLLAGTLTLSAAVDRAASTHPSLGAARASAEAANAGVGEAKANGWPSVSLIGSAMRWEEPMLVTPIHGLTFADTPQFDRTLFQIGVQLRTSLLDGGARGARVGVARAEEEAAEAAAQETEQALVHGVASSYLSALGERAILEAHDRRIEALEAERARAERLFAAGRSAQIDVLRVEATLAAARAERASSSSALDVAARRLARWIGSPVEETSPELLVDVALADTTLPVRGPEWDEALRDSPARAQSLRAVEAAERSVPLAKSARWPSLDLVGAIVDRGSSDGEFTAEWNAGVELDLPLFTSGGLSSAARRAEALHVRAREELRLVEDEIRDDADEALASLQEARARARSYESAMLRFQEVARVSKLLLEAGSGTQTDYLQAEADLLESRASLARARHAEVAARIRIARALGELDVEWIRNHLEDLP